MWPKSHLVRLACSERYVKDGHTDNVELSEVRLMSFWEKPQTQRCHAIQVEVNGQWQDVPIPAGHIAIFPGYTLERATCGLIKATKHRVVSTSPLRSK